ncbi:SDR family NAD(P)-dependent oxidoreductase [Gilvimarinus sp. SDUM040013]|uniref:SDR family NAD(P)-dependent oxidoreductase n=1 Tax=Gilvimarinus gilvus TaxID=3058038 RepID=A0ABU4S3Q9_9GAMM|nr:SDR family NAD(P)-dependent oxidoreductase [Gilvimarinus sp. SDUM040013]MDO3385568.1 SDR family NAD(P)-dependent oxidoreductase [Gilvimarinus sp. SDUM040013]MDX6851181.1 SDR family NAD(P)-dependent oxidoreductase [Gilvimarinus sp. SDUM040013]
MSSETLAGRKILLTGGTQGIGYALLELLLRSNCTVYVLARNTDPLSRLVEQYPGHVIPLAADVADAEQLKAALEDVAEIDTLILNAGTCEYIQASHFDSKSFARVLGVNLQGNANILEFTIPKLLESQRGPHIVGISSLVTELALPRSEAYGASKAGFEYLLSSLRADLYRYGVDVTIVQPGFVETPLTDRNDFEMPFIMKADEAARHVLKAITQRRYTYRFPWQLALTMRIAAKFPVPMILKFVQKMAPKHEQ